MVLRGKEISGYSLPAFLLSVSVARLTIHYIGHVRIPRPPHSPQSGSGIPGLCTHDTLLRHYVVIRVRHGLLPESKREGWRSSFRVRDGGGAIFHRRKQQFRQF